MGVIDKYRKPFIKRPSTQQKIQEEESVGSPKVIAITIAVPSWRRSTLLNKASNLLNRLPFAHRMKVVIFAALAVLILFGYDRTLNQKNGSEYSSSSPQLVRGNPPYRTILPAGKKVEDLGGWTRISPPDRNPVYTYSDKINDVSINVSEQPLPQDLKTDTSEKVELIAREFNATEKITVAGTLVHIGSSDGGSQSVVFHKDDLLILIKSTGHLGDDQWKEYIESLR